MHKLKTDIIAIVVFILLTGVFFYQTMIFGKLPVPSDALVGLYHPYRDTLASEYPNGIPFKNFLITDPVRQQIPWRKTAIDTMKAGKLPMWDAYSFSGAPLLANIQSGAFYPLNVVFFIFPFEVAWTVLIMSQPVLSGLFLYWFLRKKNLDPLSSLFGSICFAFSGFAIAWMTWGTLVSTWAWTPLTLVAIDSITGERTKHRILWALLGGFAIASSFFAGHLQIFTYSFIFIILYGLFTVKSTKYIVFYGLGLTLAALLTGLQLIQILKWLPETSRFTQGALWQLDGFFIPIQHLIQFLAPDYFGNPATLNYWGVWNYGEMVGYIGVVAIIMAFVGMGAETIFWVIACGVSLVLAIASPISLAPYQLHIPFLSSLQPTRLMVVIDFSLSVLAAYGLSKILRINKKIIILILSVMTFVFAGLWISIMKPELFGIVAGNAVIAKRNLFIPSIFFIICGLCLIFTRYISKKSNNALLLYVRVLFVLILIVDLFRFGWKFTPFTDSRYFFPKTSIISYLMNQPKPFRIMTTDDRILPPNTTEYYGIEAIGGYDPIHSSRYEEYIAASERGGSDITPPFGFERIIVPKSIDSPLLRLLNVRYILSFEEYSDKRFRKVAQEGKTILYEKSDFLPRAYLVENVIYKTNKKDILDLLFSNNFHPDTTAVVEHPVEVLNAPLETFENVRIVSYDSDKIIMQVQVVQPRMLVLGNIFNHKWNVIVDHSQITPTRVNYLFMGIEVPSGSHTVSAQYN
jgi:hypothetical protein